MKKLEKEKKNESFEQLLSKLDDTVRKLEEGGLSLEDSTNLYEQGLKLARSCSQRISDAELKITKIRTMKTSIETAKGMSQHLWLCVRMDSED